MYEIECMRRLRVRLRFSSGLSLNSKVRVHWNLDSRGSGVPEMEQRSQGRAGQGKGICQPLLSDVLLDRGSNCGIYRSVDRKNSPVSLTPGSFYP